MPPEGIAHNQKTIGINFNTNILFGQPTDWLPKPNPRGLFSNHILLIKKFCVQVVQECQVFNLYNRIHHLMNKTSFDAEDHKAIEKINQDITNILMKANKACVKLGNLPWSLQLHVVYMTHHYWSLKNSKSQTGRPYPNVYAKIKAQITPEKLITLRPLPYWPTLGELNKCYERSKTLPNRNDRSIYNL